MSLAIHLRKCAVCLPIDAVYNAAMKAGFGYAAAVCLVAGVGLGGCATRAQTKDVVEGQLIQGNVAQQQALTEGTSSLLTQAYAQMVAASAEAAAGTSDRAIQEDSLRWRINAVTRVEAIRAIEDPRLRFVALWTLIEQLQAALTDGFEKDRFGAQHGIYVKALAALNAGVLEVAYAAFPAAVVDQVKPEIAKLATHRKPAETPSELTAVANSAIAKVMYIPMAPVSGLRGVGDTPAAVNRLTDHAVDLGRMVERLPERTRWQMELFLLEAEETGGVSRALKDADLAIAEMQAFRRDFATLVTTMQKAPDQANAMLQEVLKQQPAIAEDLARIESSLKLAKQTAANADQVVQRVDGAISNTRLLLADVDKSAKAIQSATKDLRGLVADFNMPSVAATAWASATTQQTKSDDYSPAAIQSMAGEVQAGTVELRKLLADLRQPAELKGLEQAANRIERIVSKLLWGTAGLIVLFFALAIVYRRATRISERRAAA